MSVMIAILLPSLQHAQEAARRVGCASNTRQIGLSLQAYAYEHADVLPPLFNSSSSSSGAAIASMGAARPVASIAHRPGGMSQWGNDTMFVRWAAGSDEMLPGLWDGIGLMFPGEYLDEPGVLYCPSHKGRHTYASYANAWSNGVGTIASNYQYRVPSESRHLSTLDSRVSFLADGLLTKSDYNHGDGNNFLRADLAVLWYRDINGALFASLPDDLSATSSARQNLWDTFDNITDR